jgi:hypothetical protein
MPATGLAWFQVAMAACSDETWRLVEEVTDGGAFNTK